MSDADTLTAAHESMRLMLTTLGIERVVFVDDGIMDVPPVEEVIGAAVGLPRELLAGIFPEIAPVPDDPDILRQAVRTRWGDIEDGVRRERARRIIIAAGGSDSVAVNDFRDTSMLSALVPEAQLVLITPPQWEDQRKDLLSKGGKGQTLFLFDQDLSKAGGDTNSGMKIIASLLAGEYAGSVMCGLLTHTVAPDNQQQRWEELSRDHGVPRDRFLVVPKYYISHDPFYLIHLLKLSALSPEFQSLKDRMKAIVVQATSFAAGNIDKLDINVFDHIVFRLPAEEGSWEPDMLFRLHSLFHRHEARRLAHENGELEGFVQRLRSVSHIPTPTQTTFPSSAWRLQHDEIYEAGEYLNRNHLPLDLGDIFVKTGTGSSKYYILLAHPCDIMVRSNGQRQPELTHVPLAEIVSPDAGKEGPDNAEVLRYFGDDPAKKWFVKLKQAHQVRTCVLDLCAFNENGEAVFHIDGAVPSGIRPSLRARYPILGDAFAKVVKHIDRLTPVPEDSAEAKRTKESLKKPLSGAILHEGLFKGEVVEAEGKRQIRYNCQRVCRLTRARAYALLLAYTGCQARPAIEREFAAPLSCGRDGK